MFDKVIIKARIDTKDIDTIVFRNYLEQCTEGDELFYKSTAYAFQSTHPRGMRR
jgi:hypothetical protein